ncbi:MAG: ABC transporter permease [Gaiellaceae bacterium]|jgi:putative ABC transport system permease protein|nr:ABC transporter permease [Acidobacteriota bacterium]
MTGVALKGILGRKLRTALTALAIVLGVAMVSGTYILTDTVTGAFTKIVNKSYENSDAVISGKVAFKNTESDTATTPGFPASVLTHVQELADVEAAGGTVTDEVDLVGRNGKIISSGSVSPLAYSVDPSADQRFNPLTLTTGRWPTGSDKIAIDEKTANDHDYAVGNRIGVSTDEGVRQFTITGIAKFADVSSLGGATISVFDVPTAQRLFHKPGQFDEVQVAAISGVTPEQLVREIEPLLPATAHVKTSTAQTASTVNDVKSGLGVLQKFLLAFGGIALFVGSFVIANTLSITIAQRTREFATLRTIGSSRRQVLRTVMLEAGVVGLIASIVGLFLGLVLAKGLAALFGALGEEFPKGGTVIAARTIVVSLLVGIVVTLLASLRPAIKATRVPPIAAVREGATLPSSRYSRFGPIASLVTLAIGILLLVYGIFASGLSTPTRLFALGFGVLVLFIGVSLNAKRAVRPLASVLGWPGTRIGGSSGTLARENAMRNPSRTASTASALMIGLALITFVAILGAGLRSSFSDAVDKLFAADYAVTAQDGFSPFPKQADAAVAQADGVTAVTPIRAGDARIFGHNTQISAVTANLDQTVKIDWQKGGKNIPARLGADGGFVNTDYAKKHHLVIGSPVAVQLPTGKTLQFHVVGIFKAPKGGSPFTDITISTAAFDANYSKPQNIMTLVNIHGGDNASNTAQLEKSVNSYPDARIQTAAQFKQTQETDINKALNLLYGLLGLSVIISLFGVVNTLVLAVFERTRELGMLRAVGMTRRQVRSMIRHESIVTALIGGALGITVGVFLAVLTTQALSSEGIVLAIPWGTIALFVVATIVAGVLAAVFPARRASRLNVLKALQYE